MAQPTRAQTETRWPAAVAIVGLGGSSLALPDHLVPGPRWLFPIAVAVLLVPTLLAHAAGRHRLDQILGYGISIVVTLALVASLGTLVFVMGSQKQPPRGLLLSATVLWVTNILVFALWYWRLDAGGPHARDRRGAHSAGAFFFPQMMEGVPKQTSGLVAELRRLPLPGVLYVDGLLAHRYARPHALGQSPDDAAGVDLARLHRRRSARTRSACCSEGGPLLRAQRLHRIDARRAPRRDPARGECDREERGRDGGVREPDRSPGRRREARP